MSEPGETAQLLLRWHRGDRDAMATILARDLPWIRAHVDRRLGPRLRVEGDVQDYVHDAVVEILSHGPRFLIGDREQFRGLMARMVENLLRDRLEWHQAGKRDVRRQRPLPADSAISLDASLRAVTRPSEAATAHEMEAWIELALHLMAPEDRRLIWMRQFEELPFEQVADRLGIAEGTARMRFHRALHKLASKIQELKHGHVQAALGEPEATA